MRENYKEWTDSLKKKYNVSTIYSYSQIETFINDKYEYFLKYVAKVEPDIFVQSPYGLLGGLVHDILEKFYKNELKRTDCKNEFSSNFSAIMQDKNTGVFSNNENDNQKMADNFQRNLLDYFTRVDKLEGKVLCEEPISCILENDTAKAVFCGYIDVLNFSKDGRVNIIDYKTSNIYSKRSEIQDKIKQLVLYAIGVNQRFGIKFEDISVGWNFVKFAKVISKADLSEEIVERKELYKWDLTDYVVEDCIVKFDLDSDMIDFVTSTLLTYVVDIEQRANDYYENNTERAFWQEVTISDMFRLNNFCQYSAKLHKPLHEFLSREK